MPRGPRRGKGAARKNDDSDDSSIARSAARAEVENEAVRGRKAVAEADSTGAIHPKTETLPGGDGDPAGVATSPAGFVPATSPPVMSPPPTEPVVEEKKEEPDEETVAEVECPGPLSSPVPPGQIDWP